MSRTGFVIVRDARASLVHVRNERTGECLGCIEVGLFEVLQALLREEFAASAREGTPAHAARGGLQSTPARATL